MNASKVLKLGPECAPVFLPDGLAENLGICTLYAYACASPTAFTEVLEELSEDHCGHSWRSHLDELSARSAGERTVELLMRTQQLRPTAVFVYRAILIDGSETSVALATVSDRIHRSFPHDGFPVLARCYIRAAWRDHGLYPALVRHRIALCQQHWGPRLCAMHIGSSHPSVRQALKRKLGQSHPFVHVGDELLQVSGKGYRVEDMVSFTSQYRAQLLSDLPQDNALQRDFVISLCSFLDRGIESSAVAELRSLWSQIDLSMPLSLLQLFDLLAALGVD